MQRQFELKKDGFKLYWWRIIEHAGTHMDAPIHFSENGATVARQRAVRLGPVVGNDYVVESGLKAGDKLIVSGIQKIADGAPVKVTEKSGSAEAGD